MVIRIFLACTVLLMLCACAAIEIDSNPMLPTLRVDQPTANAATTLPIPSSTQAMLPRTSPATQALAPTSDTLRLTVEGAIVLALANNRGLKVDEVNPAIRQTFIAEQRAAFDPVLSANVAYSENRTERLDTFIAKNKQINGGFGISEFLPSGTNIGLDFSATHNDTFDPLNRGPIPTSTHLGLSFSQQLLRGLGPDVNLVSLHQAALDAQSSEYELRGFTQSLVQDVEDAYWDYLLAQRQVKIFDDATSVALRQLTETRARIEFGQLPRTEVFSAESEVAQRREAQINGRSQLEQARLALQRLVSLPGQSLRPRPIELLSDPSLPQRASDDIDEHLALALKMRPELNQARLSFKRDELDIVRTKNGLLPELDLFVNLGRSGYASSFNRAVSNLSDGGSHDFQAGLDFSYALGNRAARARNRRALLTRDQQLESISNLRELIEQDVRSAIIEINRVHEQVDATRATREFAEQTLRAEQDKLANSRSTLLLVAQAERDLLSAQIGEVQAATAYLKSIVALYRVDGSLLERRGISCPGADPIAIAGETILSEPAPATPRAALPGPVR